MSRLTRFASFYVVSDWLSADEITGLLDIHPDEVSVKGRPRRDSPRVPPADQHEWILNRQGDNSSYFNTMVDEFRAIITGDVVQHLRQLVDSAQCQVSLELYLNTNDQAVDESGFRLDGYVGPGFSLSSEVIIWLADLRASFGIDVY